MVGESFDLVATVRNNGPVDAPDVTLSDYLPDGLAFGSVTADDPAASCTFGPPPPPPYATAGSSPGSAGGARPGYYDATDIQCSLQTMAAGQTTTVTVSVTRSNAREIYNSVWVGSSGQESNWDNNYSELDIAA